MFSSVIFDLDGTLLDTLEDLANAGNYTLAVLGFDPHPVPAYRHMVGNGIHMLVERLLPPAARTDTVRSLAYSIFTRYYEQHMLDCTLPYPGIDSLLSQLQQGHIRMGVLSNKNDLLVQQIVTKFFPGAELTARGLSAAHPAKPDPASLLDLAQQMDMPLSTILYCGDSDVDMQTAKRAGIKSCGVLWGFRDEEELAQNGADYIAASPEEIARLVLQAP